MGPAAPTAGEAAGPQRLLCQEPLPGTGWCGSPSPSREDPSPPHPHPGSQLLRLRLGCTRTFLGSLQARSPPASRKNLLRPLVCSGCGRPGEGRPAAGEGLSGNKSLSPAGPCLPQLTAQVGDSERIQCGQTAPAPSRGSGGPGGAGGVQRCHTGGGVLRGLGSRGGAPCLVGQQRRRGRAGQEGPLAAQPLSSEKVSISGGSGGSLCHRRASGSWSR